MSNSSSTGSETTQLALALIVGSARHERMADVLLDWLRQQLAEYAEWSVAIIDLADVDLPLSGPVPKSPPSTIAAQLDAADAFLVLTPEYNHGPPAALKNAIDWHFDEWAYKPVAFVGYGAGAAGARAVEQLRLVFPELRATTIRDAVLLQAPWERIDSEGAYAGTEPEAAALERVLSELRWWAAALRAGRSAARETHGIPA